MSWNPRNRFSTPLPVAAACIALLLTACGADAEPGEPEPAWDHPNEAPAWTQPEEGWRIDPAPSVVVGLDPAEEAEAVFRVGGGVLLPAGRFAYFDGGASEVRIHSEEGASLHRLGREGDGPGEYRQPQLMGASLGGDTISIWDAGLMRVTLYALEPDPGGEEAWAPTTLRGPMPAEGRIPFPVAFLDATTVVAYEGPPEISSAGEELVGFANYTLHDGEYTRQTDFGRHRVKTCDPDAGGGACQPAPFTTYDAVDARGDMIALSSSSYFTFDLLDPESPDRPRAIGRRGARRPVDARAIDSLAARSSDSAARAVELRAATLPAYVQAIHALHVDHTGMIWARAHGAHTWSIFDEAGRWLGNLELPRGLQVLDIDASRILGTRRVGMGEEVVEVYGLCRTDCFPSEEGTS